MVTGFIIILIIINCGDGGTTGYIGVKYCNDPGSFTEGGAGSRFKGNCYVLVSGYFLYDGTELYALSVNEQADPRKATPAAAKTSIYRILIIYLLTMVLIGFNVPHNSDHLMGAGGSSATHASPYVLAVSIHGVKIVPHFINAVILISVISVANSSLYAAPRLLNFLSTQGYAPKFISYIDRNSRPTLAIIVCAFFGLIGFVAASPKEEQVFTWLAAIAGLSEIITWTGIMFSHVRFRVAMKKQGKNLNGVGYLSNVGMWGSVYGAIFGVLVTIAQFWVALAPIGNSGKVDVEAFFESYLAFPIWVASYFGYMLYNRDFTILNSLEDIDLDNHRLIYDPELVKQEAKENREKLRNSSLSYRLLKFFC